MSALTYSWHVSNVQCVGSTTRPLPSHSAQVKETRRSVYDSESGVKKMAVGHHLGERSHTIEQSQNFLSGKRVERQDFVNLEEGGSEWVWDQGGDLGVGLDGCLCQETVPICSVLEQSGRVWEGVMV